MLGIGTIVILLFGIVTASRFRLDPQTHAVLIEEIEHLRDGAREPTSAANAAIVEDLTGWRYDALWGRNPVAGPAR